MAISNLNDYYGSLGKPLPSLTERAKTYVANGGQGNYAGTAQQNAYLLAKLSGNGSPAGTTVSFNAAPAPTPAINTLGDWVTQNQGAVQAAQKNYQDAQTSLEDPTARYNRIANEQGIPQEQQTVQDLLKQLTGRQQALKNLEPQINDRLKTLGTNVTEGQRQRWVNSESTPITKQIGDLASAKSIEDAALSTKQNNLSSLLQLAGQSDDRHLKALADAVSASQFNFDTGEKAFSSDLDAKRASEENAKARAATAANEVANRAATAANERANRDLQEKLSNAKTATDQAAAQNKQTAVSQASSILSSVAGRDGFVSPGDYKKAQRVWTGLGYSSKDFNDYMAGFRNPSNKFYGN